MKTASAPAFPQAFFDAAGLNRQAVFKLAALPSGVRDTLGAAANAYRQLILLGHAGRRLWECVQASACRDSPHPIDDFTRQTIATCFAGELQGQTYTLLYPGEQAIGLQGLGELAGWHHASPFRVGIDAEWGSWFAYRAVILSDTDFAPTPRVDRPHPCLTCAAQPCISACPGKALDTGRFALTKCLSYRQEADSACRASCLARLACPLGQPHRYCDEQIRHSYSRSLQMIKAR